jgi:WRKY transcription factor 22
MFIVTYTAEHNHPAPTHRNSLAGSTRQKPLTPQTATADDSKKLNSTKPSSPATSMEEELVVPQITTTDSKEEREDMVEDEEEDEFGISDVALSDDFFVGLDGFASPAAEDYFPDHFPATFALPNWVANNAG